MFIELVSYPQNKAIAFPNDLSMLTSPSCYLLIYSTADSSSLIWKITIQHLLEFRKDGIRCIEGLLNAGNIGN